LPAVDEGFDEPACRLCPGICPSYLAS
jgi:hypothetical protein